MQCKSSVKHDEFSIPLVFYHCHLFVVVLLNDEYLLTLAQRLGNVHILLGGLLRVDSAKVQQIEYNNKNLVDITHNVLKTWRDDARWRMKDIGMVGELCAAFSTLDQNDVVEWITSCEYPRT